MGQEFPAEINRGLTQYEKLGCSDVGLIFSTPVRSERNYVGNKRTVVRKWRSSDPPYNPLLRSFLNASLFSSFGIELRLTEEFPIRVKNAV